MIDTGTNNSDAEQEQIAPRMIESEEYFLILGPGTHIYTMHAIPLFVSYMISWGPSNSLFSF